MTERFDEWFTVAEASKYLGVSSRTIYRWFRRGEIQLVRFPGRPMNVAVEAVVAVSVEGGKIDRAWLALAQESFWRDWDNEKDAIYDNWRDIYGIRKATAC